jgi:uncharacterized protein YfaS (alpha-2-macroglobulin family)
MDSFNPAPPQQGAHPHFFSSLRGKIILVLCLSAVLLLLAYFGRTYFSGRLAGVNNYVEPYVLVSDKISQSASIVLHLPKGVTVAEAAGKVVFEPAIPGEWVAAENSDELVFQPSQKLELGKYYTVTLEAQNGKLSKDFLAADDPKILSIFPAVGSEANEFSNITIVFNRPMVPLTVLDAFSDDAAKLVEIVPQTPGKFKWISTRNLQFIPTTSLVPSAHYSVHVKPGFMSVEGLSVPEATHSFITRPLRYESVLGGSLLGDQPLRIVFNQAVDLERTKGEITVTTAQGGAMALSFGYGSRVILDKNGNGQSTVVDKRILEVYAAHDRFGREKIWDFDTTYAFQVKRAYPTAGDINLETQQSGSFRIEPIINGMSAESPRSSQVAPDLFDPQGKLWFTFVEPVDKDRTVISAPHLSKADYGETCKKDADGNIVYAGNQCEKTTDYKKLSLFFAPDSFATNGEIRIEFKKIVNRDGLQLNPESVIKTAKVFPELRVTKTVPANGATGVPPTGIKLCTNTPLQAATEENFSSVFKTNLPTGKWSWGLPYRVMAGSQSPCAVGEFENSIIVGLAPEHQIHIDLNVLDDFGQKADPSLDFQTGKAPEEARNFYQEQKIYNVTSPERTKFTYSVTNLPYVNMNICEVTAETMFRYLADMPDATVLPSSLDCTNVINKRIDLPARYWTRNYFQIDLKDYVQNPLGHYVLTFSNPDYRRVDWVWDSAQQRSVRREGQLVYEKTFATVTQLAVQEKKVEWNGDKGYDANPAVTEKALSGTPQNLYWVTRFGTLEPVVGATVSLFQTFSPDDKNISVTKVDTVTTDGQGVARTDAHPLIQGAIVVSGDDSAIVSEGTDILQYASPASSPERVYMYTDRPIYRPGQEIFIKGLDRVGYDGSYETLAGKKIEVTIKNSKWETVYKENAEISDFGTFTANFTLDKNAPLGTYSMQAGSGGYGSFDVEEYVGAAFKVDTASDKDEYIAGDTAKVAVDANYYFGVPVDGGEVTYAVTSQDYYFDRYKDDYFNFGSGWYDSWYGSYGDKFIAQGKVALSKDGKAEIAQALDFSKLFNADEAKQSKIFVVNVTVKNSNGQSVSAQKSFIVHRGEYYLGVSLDKTFLGKNEKFTARVKSVDITGKPISVSAITAQVSRITWEYSKRREVDGSYYYQSTKKTEVVQTVNMSTDRDGNASHDFTVDKEGEYEFTTLGTDGRGNGISATQNFYVYGSGAVAVRPTNNETLDLAADKQTVNVDDKVNVVIKSPYERAKALITIERGKIFSYEIVDIVGNLYNYSFTVADNYVPNVYLSAVLISPRPDVKYGQVSFEVNTRQVELGVTIATDKTHYLPGEQVKLSIQANDSQGKPANAEFSLAVADLSVLALSGNPKKNPVVFFYDGLPLTVVTASNIKNVLYEAEIPAGTKGGGGGEAPGDLAKKKRGEFKDTAFWRGVVRTDSSGHAEVSFTLPDNLTTWQAEAVGITKDTKLGVAYKEFNTQKDVMVVPLRPRFIIPGDSFNVGAKIFNQTESEQLLTISFESKTLNNKDRSSYSISIKPHDTYTAYFPVLAPGNIEDGSHTFVISAKNKDYEDTVEDSIPITRNQTYETVATANYTTDASANEYVSLPDTIVQDRGGLNVKMSATLAVFLSDALQYLFSYPYGCSEQIASKLGSIAIVKRGLNIENIGDKFNIPQVEFEGSKYSVDEVVALGLNRIYQNQAANGGIAYYANLQPSYYLTLNVLNALIELKHAGYVVDDGVLGRAAQYLMSSLSTSPQIYQNNDLVILSAHTLSQLPQYENDSLLKNKILTIAANTKFIQEDISSESLAYLAIIMTRGYAPGFKETVFQSLENRLVIDSRGSHIGVHESNLLYEYYETPVKDTALLLKAYVADKRDSPILDKVIRWITRSRTKDGAWGSTNNTVSVVDAFTDFLNWKEESKSEFNLAFALDGKNIGSFDFNSSTILDTFSQSVPITDFRLNSIDTLSFEKQNKNSMTNGFYYDMDLRYYLPADQIPPRDEGFTISRSFYRRDDTDMQHPVQSALQGDVLRGHLTITVPEWRNFVTVEDYIPAGMEIVNFNLATEDKTLQPQNNNYNGAYGRIQGPESLMGSISGSLGQIVDRVKSFFGISTAGENGAPSGTAVPSLPALSGTEGENALTPGLQFNPDAEESHDDRLFLFKERLGPGVYEYDYFVRALIPGTYSHLPAVASELYSPENFGRTGGEYFTIGVQQ